MPDIAGVASRGKRGRAAEHTAAPTVHATRRQVRATTQVTISQRNRRSSYRKEQSRPAAGRTVEEHTGSAGDPDKVLP